MSNSTENQKTIEKLKKINSVLTKALEEISVQQYSTYNQECYHNELIAKEALREQEVMKNEEY